MQGLNFRGNTAISVRQPSWDHSHFKKTILVGDRFGIHPTGGNIDWPLSKEMSLKLLIWKVASKGYECKGFIQEATWQFIYTVCRRTNLGTPTFKQANVLDRFRCNQFKAPWICHWAGKCTLNERFAKLPPKLMNARGLYWRQHGNFCKRTNIGTTHFQAGTWGRRLIWDTVD